MTTHWIVAAMLGLILSGCAHKAETAGGGDGEAWSVPSIDKAALASTGKNKYFILEPGFQLVFQNENKTDSLTITVLNETKLVDGVETRIVEERETEEGKLAEVSRNYFAIDRRSGDVYYFGEDVDMYKDGKVTGHEGSWHAGIDGAQAGLVISGEPKVGMRYYQEVAPGVAQDRAQVISTSESAQAPAGKFENCLKTEESSPLEKGKSMKLYAPGVGLIKDGEFKLAKYGVMEKK